MPTELSAEATQVTWLKIEGPKDVIGKLYHFIHSNSLWNYDLKIGGTSGSWFIHWPFTHENAKLIIQEVERLKVV